MSEREVVVVTGASAGLGRAIARRFARDGAAVALLARGKDGLEGARRDCERLGGKALVIPTEVSDAAALTALFDADIESGEDRIGVEARRDKDGIVFRFPISILAWTRPE